VRSRGIKKVYASVLLVIAGYGLLMYGWSLCIKFQWFGVPGSLSLDPYIPSQAFIVSLILIGIVALWGWTSSSPQKPN
jgi:hypothetical protein